MTGGDSWLEQKGKRSVPSPEVAMGRRGLAEVLAHGSSNPYQDGRALDDLWLQPSGKLKVPGRGHEECCCGTEEQALCWDCRAVGCIKQACKPSIALSPTTITDAAVAEWRSPWMLNTCASQQQPKGWSLLPHCRPTRRDRGVSHAPSHHP